jgi:hypothetical protein
LYFYPLIVDKLMILTLDSAVFHQRFGICSQSILNYRSIVKLPARGTGNVVIQFENLFDWRGHLQFWLDPPFHCQNHSLWGFNCDCRRS